MIKVTQLNGSEYWLNPHVIEIMEAKPDTILTLGSGKKLVVKESPEKICDEIVEYRQKLGQFGNEK